MKANVELREIGGYYYILVKGIYVRINDRQYKELQKAFERKQAYKPYVVSFFREWHYDNRKNPYQLKCHFCISDLKSKDLDRYFNDNSKVIEMVVKEIATKKIIYKGNNYEEYLQVVENLMKGDKKDERD